MTPQQRMLAAIRGQAPDRLPFATYNCHPFSWGQHAGCDGYRPMLEAIRRTGAGMLCKVSADCEGGLPAPQASRSTQDGDEVSTELLQTPAGPLRRVLRKPAGQPARWVEHYVKTDADVERFLSLKARPVRWQLDGVLAKCREIGQAGVAYLNYTDPFGSIVSLFDQEHLLIRVQTDLETVIALIESAFERIRRELKLLLETFSPTGVPVLLYTGGPELATPPLMGPHLFARLVTPYQTRLVELIHEFGFPVSLHCHGRLRKVLDEVLRCGFDVLEPIEPPPQGDIGLSELRAAADGKMGLMGYVQDQDFYSATPGQIREHVVGIVETIGRGTRYIATPTCTPFQFPPTATYVGNYVAFLEAAAELGA